LGSERSFDNLLSVISHEAAGPEEDSPSSFSHEAVDLEDGSY
jgi:hypothetical protein